jgi:hypothetical protein
MLIYAHGRERFLSTRWIGADARRGFQPSSPSRYELTAYVAPAGRRVPATVHGTGAG